MAFCINCGKEIASDAKFCPECGTPAGTYRQSSPQREYTYDGKVYKCPSCGEILSSFTVTCPSCGYEIRGRKAVSSVKELAQKLEAIEAGRERKRSRSFKDRIYGEEITKTDEQKISLIRSYPIPNTKEDLYEFVILAGSNIDTDLYDGTVQKTDARLAVSDAWKAKLEQAYQKARVVFVGDSKLADIQEIYETTHKSIKKQKGKTWRQLGCVWAGILAAFIFLIIFANVQSSHDKKEEDAQLAAIVEDICNAMEACEYKHALRIADSIDYQGYSDETELEWELQREYWIDKIIDEATSKGIVLERPLDIPKSTTISAVTDTHSSEESTTTILQNLQTEPAVSDTILPHHVDATENTIASPALDHPIFTIEKGSQYTYGHDEWDLYVATAISDSVIKIEKWGKHLSSEKSFDFEYEVGAFKINDAENGFMWTNEEHTVFSFVLKDKSNSDFRKSKEITFTVLGADDTNKGSNYQDAVCCYSYKNDDWHLYKAVPLTDSILKIECWYRSLSFGSFNYGYDVFVIDINNTETDFEWTDEEHNAFTITMQDKKNSNMKKATFVVFELEK